MMKIVLIDSVADDVLTFALASNVLYRPDLQFKSTSIVVAALDELSADAVIATSHSLDEAVRTFAQGRDVIQIRVFVGPAGTRTEGADGANCVRFLEVVGDTTESAYRRALDALEHQATETLPLTRAARSAGVPRRVTLVGAGVVNLITGFHLQEAGHDIHFVDAGPEPRSRAPWTAYGCSRGGDDARMFTLSEMDNYNDKVVSQQMNSLFNARVCDLGWDVRRNVHSSADEKAWLTEYELLPVWLATRYNADIFAFNYESRAAWDAWIEREPNLFASCELREGILRLYADPFHFAAACERQAFLGATQRVLTPDEVGAFQPALGEAVEGGEIAGGIVVTGFTVNVHKFMQDLIDVMRRRGAAFEWNRRATTIRLGDGGVVLGLDTLEGPLTGGTYVISPGAYAQALLSGTRCAGKIHGVLGAWLRLSNLDPLLDRSLKLARRGHVTEDANITVATGQGGEPLMILGSGYGHTGCDPGNIDTALLRQLYAGLIDTAERFFPRAYAAARSAGMVEASLKYCVRPWTATGLGLFETLPTAQGGRCIITGGHNTGGFAQAPAIAAAVLAVLEGNAHPMHRLYHPDRTALFMDRPKASVARSLAEEARCHDVAPPDRADRRLACLDA